MLQILQLSCTFGIWWNVMIHWYNDRRHIFTRQVKCRISVSRLPGIDSLPADLWISFDSSINSIYIFQPQTQQLEFLVKVLPNFHNLKKSNVSPSPEPIGKKWELTYRAVINTLFERTSAKPTVVSVLTLLSWLLLLLSIHWPFDKFDCHTYWFLIQFYNNSLWGGLRDGIFFLKDLIAITMITNEF